MPSSKKTFIVTDQRSQSNADRQSWRNRSAEERLDAVERLRIEAGKFLYANPVRNTQSGIPSPTSKTSCDYSSPIALNT